MTTLLFYAISGKLRTKLEKKTKILILGPILPKIWVPIFFAGFISTSN